MAKQKTSRDTNANTSAGRAARGNGEGEEGGAEGLIVDNTAPGEAIAKTSDAARAQANIRPTDEGTREAVPSAELDRVLTVRSKEKWGEGSGPEGGAAPSHQELLAGSRKLRQQQVEAERKRR